MTELGGMVGRCAKCDIAYCADCDDTCPACGLTFAEAEAEVESDGEEE